MQGNPTIASSRGTASVTLTTTTETVIGTVTVTPGAPGQVISLHGNMQLTPGTGTTALTLRIRKGNGITGTVIGGGTAFSNGVTAGASGYYAVMGREVIGNDASDTYSITAQQTGASANGTSAESNIVAMAHD